MTHLLQRTLSLRFGKLGFAVGRHPVLFILTPIIMSVVLSLGVIWLEEEAAVERLYTAINGEADTNKRLIEKLFPTNTSDHFEIFRSLDPTVGAVLGITTKDEENILQEDAFRELRILDEAVKNITLEAEGRLWRYEDICAKRYDKCFENKVLSLEPRISDIRNGKYKVKYPLHVNKVTFVVEEYVENLAGVTVDEESNVKVVKALRMFYVLDWANVEKVEINRMWEKKFVEFIKKYVDLHYIKIYLFSKYSFSVDRRDTIQRLILLMPIALIGVLCFSMITSSSCDSARSKHLLGLASCCSATLAIISTFGVASMCGVRYVDVCLAIPALILGTEVDDSYILIAAWRRTNPEDQVEKRLANTFSHAAVSVTVTSLTNCLSFLVGLTAPFPIVRIFCAFAAIAVTLTCVYQITFFGGCMALSGHHEHKVRAAAYSGTPAEDLDEMKEIKASATKQSITGFLFENYLGWIIEKTSGKVIVILVFCGNISVGIWGLRFSKEGMQVLDILPLLSYSAKYLRIQDKYMSESPFPVQVVFDEPINFANITMRSEVSKVVRNLEAHPRIAGSDLTLYWYKFFEMFANSTAGKFLLSGYDLRQEKGFIEALQETFLRFKKTAQFKYDIAFNEENEKIVASRLFVVVRYSGRDDERNAQIMADLKEVTDKSPLSIKLHSIVYNFVEQIFLIRGLTIQLVWVTGVLIAVVFFVFIADVLYAACVSIVTVCTIVETIGYMFLWDVRLDMHTLIILLLGVGFSINYPAHMVFSFVAKKCSEEHSNSFKESLYDVGMPLFQGTVSNILAAAPIIFGGPILLLMIFKIIFLVSILTWFHATFVMPVLLSTVIKLRSHSQVKEDIEMN